MELIIMQIGKVGIIYDPRLVKHKSKRKHPERPMRVKGIINHFQSLGYLNHEKVEYLSQVNREVGEYELELVHKKKYIKHIASLWPKTSHRTDITVLDTYFNEHSEECAKIAVGGVLEGIDKIMKSEWQNGFAVIRPPGHHSGGRNTINGFCVFNNVAVGARYLIERYQQKRVVIFDWDIHHGDGTQAIFLNDPNVLFISIHRYDRGTYYPASEDGDVSAQGEGAGKGSNVNICLNYVDEKFIEYKFQSPGDNEYIYIYHRIIEPILKQFNPDFILVSSGLDAAIGDPLGGFSVTPNGYYYLTKQLMELNRKMFVVLEGGYSIEAMKVSAAAVMRAILKDETYPEPLSISEKQLKYNCFLEPALHNQVDQMVHVLSENWKNLLSPELKEYTNLIKSKTERVFSNVNLQESSSSSSEEDEDDGFRSQDETKEIERKEKKKKSKQQTKKASTSKEKVSKSKSKQKEKKQAVAKPMPPIAHSFEEEDEDKSVTNQFYFAAGHMQRFKNFSPENKNIYKLGNEEEINFYETMTVEKEFTPKYYGLKNNYMVLENLLYQQNDPVVIDIKISKQSLNDSLGPERQEKERKKEMNSTSEKYNFRVSGYTTPLYKEGGLLAKEDENVNKILRNAITEENREKFCQFLTDLAEAVKISGKKYFGTSIVLIKGPNKSQIRWVDFHYWYEIEQGYDTNMVEGLNNLKKFIKELSISG